MYRSDLTFSMDSRRNRITFENALKKYGLKNINDYRLDVVQQKSSGDPIQLAVIAMRLNIGIGIFTGDDDKGLKLVKTFLPPGGERFAVSEVCLYEDYDSNQFKYFRHCEIPNFTPMAMPAKIGWKADTFKWILEKKRKGDLPFSLWLKQRLALPQENN